MGAAQSLTRPQEMVEEGFMEEVTPERSQGQVAAPGQSGWGTAQQAEGTARAKAWKAERTWLELPTGVGRGRGGYCRALGEEGDIGGGGGVPWAEEQEKKHPTGRGRAAVWQEGAVRPRAGVFSSLSPNLLIWKVGDSNQS